MLAVLELKKWWQIGTKRFPRRKLTKQQVADLRAIGTVKLDGPRQLCHGTRPVGKGDLTQAALWFAFDERLCKSESRPNLFSYILKPRHQERGIELLDLREAEGQAGYQKAMRCYEILAEGTDAEEEDYNFSRDEIVPMMLYRALENEGIHGWVAYDDNDMVECLLLRPHRLLKRRLHGMENKKMPPKKKYVGKRKFFNS
jgi:hypothetical protein